MLMWHHCNGVASTYDGYGQGKNRSILVLFFDLNIAFMIYGHYLSKFYVDVQLEGYIPYR